MFNLKRQESQHLLKRFHDSPQQSSKSHFLIFKISLKNKKMFVGNTEVKTNFGMNYH